MHRPSSVDDPTALRHLADTLAIVSRELPLVFPLHPRTRNSIERFGIDLGPLVRLMRPLGYVAFLNLWKDAAMPPWCSQTAA
jgi:UDP-N-acetylglucosamine 2-epimerase (non-hydrolysing)